MIDPPIRLQPARARQADPAKSRRRRPLRMAVLCGAALFLCLGGLEVSAGGSAADPMRSLDEQVQEIKTDVLSIAAELSLLEEKLLYPSNTQVALFVSLSEGDELQLDSVRIELDGQPVAHHIYSFKELEALQKGGVQRIYTGNVTSGAHEMAVTVAGKLPGGSDFDATERFRFEKEVDPKLVGITLARTATGGARIELGGW